VREVGISILPDLLANNLNLVIVGPAAGRASANRQLYYAGPGNRFWRTLYEVGLTPVELRLDDYPKLLDYGIGLTDLEKGACGADSNLKPADFDRLRLRAVIKTRSPSPGLQRQDHRGALFRCPDDANQIWPAAGCHWADSYLCLLLYVAC
jgi:hypothetical protein